MVLTVLIPSNLSPEQSQFFLLDGHLAICHEDGLDDSEVALLKTYHRFHLDLDVYSELEGNVRCYISELHVTKLRENLWSALFYLRRKQINSDEQHGFPAHQQAS